MQRFNTTMLLMTLALSLSDVTLAHSANAPLQKTINFGQLDLTRTDAAEHLFGRLHAAAKEVCEPVNGSQVRQKREYRSCVRETLANAVAEIDNPRLTSVYDSKGGATVRAVRLATK